MEYRTKSVFGRYAEQLQVLIDTNIEKFKEPFFPKYFGMGSPQMGLTYATVIGRARIEAAASVVAHGSEAPLRSRAGLEKLSGEIAALKVKRKMDEADYRDYLTMQALNVSDEAKKSQILQLIWNDVKYAVDSVTARLDIMVAQALSTGIIPINTTTNPDGVIPGNIDLLVPAAHKETGTAAFSWTLTGRRWDNAASATPITDVTTLTQNLWNNEGIVHGKMLMTPTMWWSVQKSAEVVSVFSGAPTLDNFNSMMQSLKLPIVELVNVRARVESDGVLSSVSTWNSDNMVSFVPEGQLGTIHNALSVEQISPVSGVDYAVSSNILVSKWAQTEPFGEFTRGEIAAFPGLEIADTIHIVNVQR